MFPLVVGSRKPKRCADKLHESQIDDLQTKMRNARNKKIQPDLN